MRRSLVCPGKDAGLRTLLPFDKATHKMKRNIGVPIISSGPAPSPYLRGGPRNSSSVATSNGVHVSHRLFQSVFLKVLGPPAWQPSARKEFTAFSSACGIPVLSVLPLSLTLNPLSCGHPPNIYRLWTYLLPTPSPYFVSQDPNGKNWGSIKYSPSSASGLVFQLR